MAEAAPTAFTNQSVGKVQYFSFAVPPDALGWDLRRRTSPAIRSFTSAGPIAARLWGLLDTTIQFLLATGGNWVTGYDWTGDYYNRDSNQLWPGVWRRNGQSAFRPATIMWGSYNYTGSTPLSYTLLSHGIGGPYSIPITPLTFSNGVVTVSNLAPRQAALLFPDGPSNMPVGG